MTTPTTATTMVARSPQDLLAVVPIVLGFVPQDSVVMLTFGARATFHARVDLPGPGRLPDAVDALLEPAQRHAVQRVAFVLYSEDARLCSRLARALTRAFEAAGIDVLEPLRADGRRWYVLTPGRAGTPGVPYDVSAHPFAVQAVFEGRVTLGSRDELAASLAPVPERVAAVSATLDRSPGGPGPVAADEDWLRTTLARHVRAGTVPPDDEVARLLRVVAELPLLELAWSAVDRRNARDHVGFWTEVVRRSPAELLPAPAALLGFAAWLAGHGALAWCAVDACRGVDPDHRLADLLAQLLEGAVPPSEWDRETGRAVPDGPA